MNSWPNIPSNPEVVFFNEDFYSEKALARKLSNWMWQHCFANFTTSAIYIAPLSTKTSKKNLLLYQAGDPNQQILDIYLGGQKYFFKVWAKSQKSQVTLLIDFNVEQNCPEMRELNPSELLHALIIGMSAYRVLRTFNVQAKSFLLAGINSIGIQLERVRANMEDYNLSFEEAKSLVSHDTAMLFDSRPGPHEEVDFLKISSLLKNYAEGYATKWPKFLELGAIGVNLEERRFSFRKFAVNFVTLWPSLSQTHESFAKTQLARFYETLSPQDIPLDYLGVGFPIAQHFDAKDEVYVIFDMRGANFEIFAKLFDSQLWVERSPHSLLNFKIVLLKDYNQDPEIFQTKDGRPFSSDQILLNFDEIEDLEELAKKTTLYVRGELSADLNDDLFSLYLMSHGTLLFMDDIGWWQNGFRFEFGRRWETGHENSAYFIQQFFDVLIQEIGRRGDYRQRLEKLRVFMESHYSSPQMALRLKNSYINKLNSFHDYLHCFDLKNFKDLENKSKNLSRNWNAISAIHLDIEGDYFILERESLSGLFAQTMGTLFDTLEIEVSVKLYIPKIDVSTLVCELILFDDDANIKDKIPFELIEVEGKGTSQCCQMRLNSVTFSERTIVGIRLTPHLSHFEFPFETKLSAWV